MSAVVWSEERLTPPGLLCPCHMEEAGQLRGDLTTSPSYGTDYVAYEFVIVWYPMSIM